MTDEVRKALQRDLDQWAKSNHTVFNKGKYWVLQWGQSENRAVSFPVFPPGGISNVRVRIILSDFNPRSNSLVCRFFFGWWGREGIPLHHDCRDGPNIGSARMNIWRLRYHFLNTSGGYLHE